MCFMVQELIKYIYILLCDQDFIRLIFSCVLYVLESVQGLIFFLS